MSINYRYLDVVDNEGVIELMTDSAHALQFIRYYASSTFNIDHRRVAIFGNSAGAGTALWLASHDDLADFGYVDPVRRMSTRPQAVAVNETQASYNVVRWSDDVFDDYSSQTGDRGHWQQFRLRCVWVLRVVNALSQGPWDHISALPREPKCCFAVAGGRVAC